MAALENEDFCRDGLYIYLTFANDDGLYDMEDRCDTLEKLALIDMGEFSVEGSVNPHVLFAGKLYRDSRGSLTFANLFTLVFEK